MQVVFLATSGDAILIETPGGKHILVDGGEDPTELALALGRYTPFWQRTLYMVILTQSDEARLIGQIAVLQRYQTRYALAPAMWEPSSFMEQWGHLLTTQQTQVLSAQEGGQIPLDGALLTIPSIGMPTHTNTTLYLHYGTTSFLFVLHCHGNMEAEVAHMLEHIPLPVTVLAYPWACTLPPMLLERTQPDAIVFTTGAEQIPPALLSYADRRNLGKGTRPYAPRLFHPKLDGTVTFVSDGQNLSIVDN
jgi:hypothetical protein